MGLSLPPKSIIRCDEQTAQQVHDQLTSVIAGHPGATTTFRFYEVLDAWLGPWGPSGYPIGYGKFYNVAFTRNEKLRADPAARRWVWRTTVLLQEALRDHVVASIRSCALSKLTQDQLRKAAFDSHPRAYDRGGLATVILTAPELIPIIVAIPSAEFSPDSVNFGPTMQQVFETFRLVVPKLVGATLASSAGPAHTGLVRRAARQDQRRFLNHMMISRELGTLKALITQGRLDHVPWLEQIITQLNARQFPDQGFARLAGEVVHLAEVRRRRVIADYLALLPHCAPEVRNRLRRDFPAITTPGKMPCRR